MLPPPENKQASVTLRELDDADRDAISQWRYEGPLALYSPGEGAQALHGPDHLALTTATDPLLGYGTLGIEARVPGGRYSDSPDTVDVGLGLRPNLVGAGYGAAALAAVIGWARDERRALHVRATIAAANRRACALVEHAGFEIRHRFERARDQRRFVQYERLATTG